MLQEQTLTKLYAMKLNGMAEGYEEQLQQARMGKVSFEDRFGLLVDRQWIWKEDRALRRRLNYAGLKQQACVEDIDYRSRRGLNRAAINQLSTSEWIKHHQAVIITGPTGVSKSFLACALAHKACRDGYRALYYYVPKLFRQIGMAHADGSLMKLLKKIAKAEVLVIDDWGISRLQDQQCRDFLDILDDRHGSGATLITSQFDPKDWHQTIADPTVADAILDRLVHNAHRISLTGESMRRKKKRS
ncbi:MAG TPA: AAA family ATPase [Planctomycetaceae bacterium]|nr:AAA family ATPase [Planctomycetaceae bacterium]